MADADRGHGYGRIIRDPNAGGRRDCGIRKDVAGLHDECGMGSDLYCIDLLDGRRQDGCLRISVGALDRVWHSRNLDFLVCFSPDSTTESGCGRAKGNAGGVHCGCNQCRRLIRVNVVMKKDNKKTIWIDLDNSPHVPFFVPIIRELEKQGHSVLLTARDCFQVRGLADMYGLSYKLTGRHYGKNKIMKLAGIAIRSAQMLPTILKNRPDLAVSHGSRAQVTIASLLRIPSVVIADYEHAKVWAVVQPTWVMTPEVIANELISLDKNHILQYPGIKEDVYVPNFSPNDGIKNQLGLNGQEIVVTVRPPA